MKILVIHYSQTGQLTNILKSITSEIKNSFEIEWLNIKPVDDFDFPWSSESFFDVMPDSFGLKSHPIIENRPKHEKYDLIIFGYQVWFLSPSIPANSFLESKTAKNLFKNSKVVTVLGVRNMWIGAHKVVKQKISTLGGNIVGNIVLEDKAPNLISVITIVKWLIEGNKGPYKFLPNAGVNDKEIEDSSKFGKIIQKNIENKSLVSLQKELIENGAVKIHFSIARMEWAGIRIFKKIYNIHEKASSKKSKKRVIKLFKIYLFIVLFTIGPLAEIIFSLAGWIGFLWKRRCVKKWQEV